ncbi:MAG TPA: hypothetical protein VGS19_06855 [Streptosporangiaceae bacterium]|nr:hypothetical protein [Streptosporangiaceae bacterium]
MAAVAAIALLATSMAGEVSGASLVQAKACTPTWRLVRKPAVPIDGLDNTIRVGLPDVLSRGDMFLVVSPKTMTAGNPNPDVLHWDGSSVSKFAPLPHDDLTEAVGTTVSDESFDSSSDGWVLGSAVTGNTLARWHGGRWMIVPPAVSPRPATDWLRVSRVVAVSPISAWAVGESFQAGNRPSGALIEHWNGTQWVTVANPAAQRVSALVGLAMVSARDIWAVGSQGVSPDGAIPLVEHWDGARWNVIPVPKGHGASSLYAISAAGPRDVWVAGGQAELGPRGPVGALVEHWNGVTWNVARGVPHLRYAGVDGVYAAGPHDVWAVSSNGVQASFLHWDGKTWSAQPVPGPKEYGLQYGYYGMGGSGPDDVWAVGQTYNFATMTGELQLAHLSCGKS